MLTTQERAELVGARIREARSQASGSKKNGSMSQEDLAARLAVAFGTTPERERRALVNNETGRNAPQLRRLQAIAEATGKPLDFFAVVGGDADGIDAVRFREAV